MTGPTAPYKAWEINEKNFPHNGSTETKIMFFLRYGILAPSQHNTQPWMFKVLKDSVEIFPNWKFTLNQADPQNRYLFISLGCCIMNIIIAAAYFKYNASYTIKGDYKDTFIRITFLKVEKKDNFLANLFPYITKRYSDKLFYKNEPIKKPVLSELVSLNKTSKSTAIFMDNNIDIKKISSLHEKAISYYFNNKQFRKELTTWLRYNNSNRKDGMPGFVLGINSLQYILLKFFMNFIPFIISPLIARKEKTLLKSSPLIGVITTQGDDIKNWIETGMTYEKISLVATKLGVSMCPMTAILENNSKDLLQLFHVNNKTIQMFFRLGYTNNKHYHTPRRNLEETLI